MKTPTLLLSCSFLFLCAAASAQTPFTPPPILPGGQVVPLYPPGSPFLNAARIAEPSIILRNRLRRDGYNAQTDAVYDAQQAVRLVRSRASEWGIDPKKIGVIGFSAGAELAAPAATFFEQFEKANSGAGDSLAA